MTLYYDNQATIYNTFNLIFFEQTKHIKFDCHYIREKIQEIVISPSYAKSLNQFAYIFTKTTTSNVCDSIYDKIGLLDTREEPWGRMLKWRSKQYHRRTKSR